MTLFSGLREPRVLLGFPVTIGVASSQTLQVRSVMFVYKTKDSFEEQDFSIDWSTLYVAFNSKVAHIGLAPM